MNENLEHILEGITCKVEFHKPTNSIKINYSFEQNYYDDYETEILFKKSIDKAKELNKSKIYLTIDIENNTYSPIQNPKKLFEKLDLKILKSNNLINYIRENELKGVTLKKFEKLKNRVYAMDSGFSNLNSYRTQDFKENTYKIILEYIDNN